MADGDTKIDPFVFDCPATYVDVFQVMGTTPLMRLTLAEQGPDGRPNFRAAFMIRIVDALKLRDAITQIEKLCTAPVMPQIAAEPARQAPTAEETTETIRKALLN